MLREGSQAQKVPCCLIFFFSRKMSRAEKPIETISSSVVDLGRQGQSTGEWELKGPVFRFEKKKKKKNRCKCSKNGLEQSLHIPVNIPKTTGLYI